MKCHFMIFYVTTGSIQWHICISDVQTGNLAKLTAEFKQRIIAQNSDMEDLSQLLRNLTLKQG